jgi:hypothetical protein
MGNNSQINLTHYSCTCAAPHQENGRENWFGNRLLVEQSRRFGKREECGPSLLAAAHRDAFGLAAEARQGSHLAVMEQAFGQGQDAEADDEGGHWRIPPSTNQFIRPYIRFIR